MPPPAPTDTRRLLGALGERLAREHLARAGYDLVEANFRCRQGELDLVVANANALVFCEVKTRIAGSRAGPDDPLAAIGPAKQRRLRLLAREWLHAHPGRRPRPPALRFDAIGVTLSPRGELLALEHVEDAF